jgi:hypothetical protein
MYERQRKEKNDWREDVDLQRIWNKENNIKIKGMKLSNKFYFCVDEDRSVLLSGAVSVCRFMQNRRELHETRTCCFL